jgi:ubiquinol-cytochrome c reductase cytochrome b subunit
MTPPDSDQSTSDDAKSADAGAEEASAGDREAIIRDHSVVLRPLIRLAFWLEDRTGLWKNVAPILQHPVPPNAKWMYIFGSATMMAFMIQVLTGTALATIYVPSTSQAYSTLQYITHGAAIGRILRGMHYFGASAMVLLVGIHMARVYLTASYKYPRAVNWLTGIVLLFLTLGLGFTGQLLRWDQNGVWSVVVAAEQAGRVPFVGHYLAQLVMGGDTVGGTTLSRFFAIHVFFIPGLIFGFLALHLYLVLQHGISEPPKAGDPVDPKTYRKKYEAMLKKGGVPFWPDAAWRDAIFSLVVCLTVLILAITIGPPELDKAPNPTLINAVPRPDWYFFWYFALMALLPQGSAEYLLWIMPLALVMVPTFLPVLFNKGERSLAKRPWAPIIVLITVVTILALWRLGIKAPWTPRFDTPRLSAALVNSDVPEVKEGARLFHDKACIYCHLVDGQGGVRGPDLTHVADRLSRNEMIWRISNGGYNMPGYTYNMTATELADILAFLQSRSPHPTTQPVVTQSAPLPLGAMTPR